MEFYTTPTDHETFSLFYEKEMSDIPFIRLSGAQQFLLNLGQESGISDYTLTSTNQEGLVSWSRDNGSKVVFDFTGKSVTFTSFAAFSALPFFTTPLDPVSLAQKDSANKPLYIYHDAENSSINHPGAALRLDLGHYDIPMIYEKNEGYIPLQFFSDFLLSQTFALLAYNGQAVFVLPSGDLGDLSDLY